MENLLKEYQIAHVGYITEDCQKVVDRLTDLSHRRGIAVLVSEGADIVINLLLLLGQFAVHGKATFL